MSTAHPRSRGENTEPRTLLRVSGGSSPLTRGKPPTKLSFVLMRGLIPAHAGKTMSAVFCSAAAAAHPRSRGENLISTKGTARSEGSSPLTRGKLKRITST